MSKRVRKTRNEESKDYANETNSIYIPQVKINYGAYGQTSNVVNIILKRMKKVIRTLERTLV